MGSPLNTTHSPWTTITAHETVIATDSMSVFFTWSVTIRGNALVELLIQRQLHWEYVSKVIPAFRFIISDHRPIQ
jgi:hypothetical protein